MKSKVSAFSLLLVNKLFPLVCSVITYTLGSTNPTSVLFLIHCTTEADLIVISQKN